MAHTGHRYERIAEEIHHEITAMLEGELKDPRIAAFATVTEVRLSHGMKQVRIYVNVQGTPAEQDSTMKGLLAAAGFIKHELIERLRLRRGPELLFILDNSEQNAQHIEELLREAKKANRE